MSGLRSKVARKTGRFIKKAQQMPPAPGGPAPTPGVPAGPDAAPGAPKPPAAPKPPMPGGAPTPGAPPGPPGQLKPKEEIEQDVEKDIRQRKEQEHRIRNIEDKVTGLSDQMDGLTKSINKLMNEIQKGQGGPTDFDKKFEDLKDTKEDMRSPSEFGVKDEEESLIVSKGKEGQKMSDKEKLRKARNERVEAKELTFEMKDMPNKKYKQQVPSPTITKLKKAPEDWGQYRLSAATLALDLNAAENEWAVVNKETDEVFFIIQPTEETQEVFAKQEFAEQIIKDIRALGLTAAMEKYAAKPFELFKKKEEPKDKPLPLKKKLEDKPLLKKKPVEEDRLLDEDACMRASETKKTADDGDEVETPSEDAEAPAEEASTEEPEASTEEPEAATEEPSEEPTEDAPAEDAPAEEAAPDTEEASEEAPAEEPTQPTAALQDYGRKFVRAFRLALSAQQKNLIDNPLKAAWYEVLAGMGIPEATNMIEATFARAAAEQFEVALGKTAEYLNLSDEAFVDVEAQIGEFNTKPPQTENEHYTEERQARSAALRARASRGSLPFSSATDELADNTGRIFDAAPKPKLAGISKYGKPF